MSLVIFITAALTIQDCTSYYQAQYAQVAPLKATRDLCVNMIPPYLDRRPFQNRYEMKVEVQAMWISHKRLSISAFSPPDKYQAFSGMMVQLMQKNLPIGTFEPEEKLEIADCPPGTQNLACLRSSRKLLQAAVNWVSPPGFDVYNPQLECVVTIIGLNQKFWTIDFPIDAAPYKYPEYGNFTNELINTPSEDNAQPPT